MRKRDIAKLIVKTIWETYTEDPELKKPVIKDPFAKYAEEIESVGHPALLSEEDTIIVWEDYEMHEYYADIYYYDKYDPIDPMPNKTVNIRDLKRTGFRNQAVRNIANRIPDINPYYEE